MRQIESEKMARINNKMESNRNAIYKETKVLKRGSTLLGGAAFIVIFAPIIFVTFNQVVGKEFIDSENDKSREVAIEEG